MQPVRTTLALLFVLCAIARAEDVYYAVPLSELKVVEGTLPTADEKNPNQIVGRMTANYVFPSAQIDGGEAYPGAAPDSAGVPQEAGRIDALYVRVPAGVEPSGLLFVPKLDESGLVRVKFSLPADKHTSNREAFYRAKLAHYQQLQNSGIPGTAWFRRCADEARKALGLDAANDPQRVNRPNRDEVDDTYSLFTGGRAVSENLQLDRPVATTQDSALEEDVDSIYGVNVAEIDWKPLIKDLHPQIDPLADIIPADQHAIFFPSFDAVRSVIQYADDRGAPVLATLEERSEDAGTSARYEKQLGLSLNDLSKMLGPMLIDSVAVTGSDPYLRVGTDIAVIFQTKNPAALQQLMSARVALRKTDSQIVSSDGTVEGLNFSSYLTPDRSVSCYLAVAGNAVIVTNSKEQLARLARVVAKQSPALSGAPEYIYFRNRYPRGAEDETAFVILTDATIRRWCGPRWRIADARRTRAAALMSEITAQNLDALVTGKVEGVSIAAPPPELGDLRLAKIGAVSSVYGSLGFMTPISELDIKKVSRAEKAAYTRWRNQYQSYWKWAFDPIAAKLTINEKQVALDLSVIPLIFGTDYRTIVDLSRGVELPPGGGDPHDALLQVALALNLKSSWIQMGANFAGGMTPSLRADPFSWVGKCASIYFDDDPFWAEAAKCKPQDMNAFFEKNFHRLPVALYIESSSVLKLTAFVTGVRAYIEQTVPGMSIWEAQQYNGAGYVKITPSEAARTDSRELENVAIYYAASGNALVIALREDVLKRALDRQAAARASSQPTTRPWLGQSVAMRMQRPIIDLYMHSLGWYSTPSTQMRSWSNLPILNEWKRLYPNEDPVKLHQRIWGTTLLCPGGGEYVWNDQARTMQSSAYGTPIEPKGDPQIRMLPDDIRAIDAGLTFEQNGLRARAVLQR